MAYSSNLGRKIYMKRTYLKPDVKIIDFKPDENLMVDMSSLGDIDTFETHDLENAGREIGI